MINGLLIHGLDYDDTHPGSVVHATAARLPIIGPAVGIPDGVDHQVLADHGLFDADPEHTVFRELSSAARQVYMARTQL